MTQNKRLVLSERPGRGPITPKTFKKEAGPLPPLGDNEVLVKVEYASIVSKLLACSDKQDPAMRMWLVDTPSYLPPVQIGETMRASGLGRVVKSNSPDYQPGDLAYGTFGWQEYWQGPTKQIEPRHTPKGAQDVDHLGLLGVSGMTAYFGIFDVGRLKDGETVVISGAAGSVGLVGVKVGVTDIQIVTQIAVAHKKCKVIAIAGAEDKCAELRALGATVVLNYKDKDFTKKLRAAAKGGIDVYFDNVGGQMLDTVLTRIKPYARIVLCGAISQYK